jgi:hypothetical protein
LRTLIVLGVTVFLAAVIWRAPVAVLYGWFKPDSASVELYGLHGTLGQGSVAGISLNDKPAWQELHWTWNPLGLLLGRAVMNVSGSAPANLASSISATPWGMTRLHDLHVDGSLRAVLTATGQGYLPVEGMVTGDLSNLKLKGQALLGADGSLDIRSLNWTLAKDPLLLGDYKAVAATIKDEIVVKIESVSGPLQVAGDIKLAADQSYTVDLQVKAKPGATNMLQTLVQSLGQPDAQGFYHLRRQGKLG